MGHQVEDTDGLASVAETSPRFNPALLPPQKLKKQIPEESNLTE